jgi:hypothetical protein
LETAPVHNQAHLQAKEVMMLKVYLTQTKKDSHVHGSGIGLELVGDHQKQN